MWAAGSRGSGAIGGLVTIAGQMVVLTGAFHVVAAVIAAGGAAKVASPDAFAALLRSLGVRVGRAGSRAVGAAEVLLGVGAISMGGRGWAAAVAVAYAAFAVAVVSARRVGAASCGCFGAASAPPGAVHVVVNSLSAAVALATAAAGDVPAIDAVLRDQPALGIPYVLAVATGAWLVITVDTGGAVLADRVRDVAAMGPTYRANSGFHDHRHDHGPGGQHT